MATTAEAIQRLETRAAGAEKLIEHLREQIKKLKLDQTNGIGGLEAKEIQGLKAENEGLRKEILSWKGKLCAAEKANGKVQVQGPAGECKDPPAAAPEADEGSKSKESKTSENKAQSGKKSEKKKKDKPAPSPAEEVTVDVGRLDMRVGLIKSAKKHPDADALYVEEVDVGEEKPRTVISGLVKFIPEDQMQNRMAILLCNLKPVKMRGIFSEAMVMCASTPDKVEILCPPEGSKPGDLVQVDGYERKPDAQLNPKKKVFETCAPDLKVDGSQVATYKGVPWTVNGKKVASPSLSDVQIK